MIDSTRPTGRGNGAMGHDRTRAIGIFIHANPAFLMPSRKCGNRRAVYGTIRSIQERGAGESPRRERLWLLTPGGRAKRIRCGCVVQCGSWHMPNNANGETRKARSGREAYATGQWGRAYAEFAAADGASPIEVRTSLARPPPPIFSAGIATLSSGGRGPTTGSSPGPSPC